MSDKKSKIEALDFSLPPLLETYGSMVVLMFQQNPYFWAAEDATKGGLVRCEFCHRYSERPDTLDHDPLCVIEGLMRMIHHDESLKSRILSSRKRPILNYSIELTVYKGGDLKRKKVHHN